MPFHFALVKPLTATLWILTGALFLLIVTVRYKSFFEKGIHTKSKPFKKQVLPKRSKK